MLMILIVVFFENYYKCVYVYPREIPYHYRITRDNQKYCFCIH